MANPSHDKVAMVTGGGSGLGAAIAARLATDGVHVVVNDVVAAAAEKVAADVGGEALAFDVADSARVDAAVGAVVERCGRLDVLVNNAGIPSQRAVPVDSTAATSLLTDDAWRRMLEVHLSGTFFCTRAALRHMRATGGGSIVNMASIAGIHGLVGAAEYAAAKGGIIAFTRSVAAEVGPLGIRVNTVAPGFIDTPMIGDVPPEGRAIIAGRTAARRLGRPEEVAELVAYLASEAASYCYGEVFTISGGWD